MSLQQDSREAVLNLRRRFAQERAELSEEPDPRDVTRIETDDIFLQKFFTHKKGNAEEAFQMLVNALAWRKSFGVNDINLQTIDTELVEAGMSYSHGHDREGNRLLIINVRMHKKDAEKLPKIKRFMVYQLEHQMKRDPHGRLSLIFDMTECGLSNMDLDFIRFVIDCFGNYYPSMLAYILVFDMPYLLQAVWKVVKGWLSESGRSKIKFVNRSEIRSYIDVAQLLVRFGGEDEWLFSADEVVQEYRRVENSTSDASDGSAGRRVRFAESMAESPVETAAMPRPSQSIPGNLYSLPDNAAESGSSLGMTQQHRQVQQLLKANQQRSTATGSSGKRTNLLDVTPSETLEFHGSGAEEILLPLLLSNVSSGTIGFKVKTTAPDHYRVKPSTGVISTGASAAVQITLLTGSQNWAVTHDKFLIEGCPVPPSTTVNDLPRLFRTVDRSAKTEHRLRAVLIRPNGEDNGEYSLRSQKSSDSYGDSSALQEDIRGLQQEVRDLQQEQRHLRKQLEKTNSLAKQLLSFLLLCLVIIIAYLGSVWRVDTWLQ